MVYFRYMAVNTLQGVMMMMMIIMRLISKGWGSQKP
jgi:hypothetical protein